MALYWLPKKVHISFNLKIKGWELVTHIYLLAVFFPMLPYAFHI